ncbi:hypothetical protein HMPREF9430_01062 [Solobacterium moorei F0204]|uniref:Uncharacterized protein n=1 Tax=Solobacterium moorei F0204 TaxID=706433 RepID=E7MNE3_9FIRM|nr:hypothetical protein HMPREF9430_01062 [Solobacterium moorei F0204]
MIFLEIYEIIIPTMMEKSRNKDIKRSMVIDKIRSKMISITEQSNDGIKFPTTRKIFRISLYKA